MKSQKGLHEWTIQRLSAVYAAIYIILFFAYLAFHPALNYHTWRHAFDVFWVQIPSLIFLVALLWHVWIGMWTIFTDYVHCSCIRAILNIGVLLALFVYFFWGVVIIWHLPLAWTF
jgi:succinate dehydrogenase / fumarate reductase, membrane anchor subunit